MADLLVHPFEPVYDAGSKVLILGSFPSVVSRKQSFYYANKANRFWPLMECIFEDSAEDRISFCHRHHIALWDVIHSCTIEGSSDASIRNAAVNDIGFLLKETSIHVVFTTGSRASSLYEKHIHLPVRHVSLPSTSSANARMKLEDLKKYYDEIRYEAEKD